MRMLKLNDFPDISLGISILIHIYMHVFWQLMKHLTLDTVWHALYSPVYLTSRSIVINRDNNTYGKRAIGKNQHLRK